MKVNFKEKLAGALSLPAEIALDLPAITLTGFSHFALENYKNLLEFSQEKIRIHTNQGHITVEGQGLLLKEITSEDLVIGGHIQHIALQHSPS